MTISSTSRVAGPFTGDGSTAAFPFSFKVFKAADVLVVTITLATGAIATLALTTDYTVTLNADQDTSPGGSITLTAGNLASGMTLSITTDMANLQGLDLTEGGAFYPDTVNAALDTLTILAQQIAAQVARAILAPFGDTAANLTLPPAAERAAKVLMFDANGNLTLVPIAAGGTVPGAQAAAGTVDGNNKVFSFTASSDVTPTPLVFIGGVFQTPGDDYAIGGASGSSWPITFDVAPAQGPVTVVLLA